MVINIHSSRGVLPSVVCLSMIMNLRKLQGLGPQGLLHKDKKKQKFLAWSKHYCAWMLCRCFHWGLEVSYRCTGVFGTTPAVDTNTCTAAISSTRRNAAGRIRSRRTFNRTQINKAQNVSYESWNPSSLVSTKLYDVTFQRAVKCVFTAVTAVPSHKQAEPWSCLLATYLRNAANKKTNMKPLQDAKSGCKKAAFRKYIHSSETHHSNIV